MHVIIDQREMVNCFFTFLGKMPVDGSNNKGTAPLKQNTILFRRTRIISYKGQNYLSGPKSSHLKRKR
uniref:Uncharacterized protein n=1 Tax=Anguilla anguilla TaxID=7936 RepID=A0A0E9VGM3_ANGAN